MEKPSIHPSAPLLSYLQHYPAHKGSMNRIALEPLPFRIGRDKKNHFAISSKEISKSHVEITCASSDFVIRDLGSTNGTFVNGQRIEQSTLQNGDIIHVAHEEFRFERTADGALDSNRSDLLFTEPVQGDLPASVAFGRQCLQEMLGQKSVQMLFQPIVDLDSQEIFGFEALARGTHPQLSIKPGELFGLAERCGLAPSLSQMFRQKAIEAAAQLPGSGFLFLNLHPAEMGNGQLIQSLRALVGPSAWKLVLEIHEDAAGDMEGWKKFRQQVKELDLLVAYDDFGAGKARILELAELPPDFVKLDMRLIHNLHHSRARQRIIEGVVHSSRDQGVQVIAEGVESDDEANICRELGCHFGQGFFFGHPHSWGTVTRSKENGKSGKDRRSYARLPGSGIALVRPEAPGNPMARSARIIDFSRVGIALLLNYQFPAGTMLTLSPIGWDRSSPLTTKVVHCKEVDGNWLHGCQFVEKLNRKDLEHFFSFNLRKS